MTLCGEASVAMETPGFGAAGTMGHLPRRAADVARSQLEPKWEALCAAAG